MLVKSEFTKSFFNAFINLEVYLKERTIQDFFFKYQITLKFMDDKIYLKILTFDAQ